MTLHFVERDARLATLQQIRERLRPGAPLLAVHHSVPSVDRLTWLERSARFGAEPGANLKQPAESAKIMAERLPLLSPQEDSALLTQAGFRGVELFYAALTFRGWLAYA